MIDVGGERLDEVPFVTYPGQGRRLLGRIKGDNCRHGYGLAFMRLTGQTHCAYCGLDLATRYEDWLNMALDHVVPRSACLAWGVQEDWREDSSNLVLACTACNTFGNRYAPSGFECPASFEEFCEVRDAIFLRRKLSILERHRQERAFFEGRPWAR